MKDVSIIRTGPTGAVRDHLDIEFAAPQPAPAFACMDEDEYDPGDERVPEYWHWVRAETPAEAAELFVEERTEGLPEDGAKRTVRVLGHGAFDVWAHLSANYSATAAS